MEQHNFWINLLVLSIALLFLMSIVSSAAIPPASSYTVPSSSPARPNSSQATNGARHPIRHHHSRTSQNRGTHVHSYQIVRPGLCAHQDTIYADCFLCGKVSEDSHIYRGCCEGDREITHYCDRLLS